MPAGTSMAARSLGIIDLLPRVAASQSGVKNLMRIAQFLMAKSSSAAKIRTLRFSGRQNVRIRFLLGSAGFGSRFGLRSSCAKSDHVLHMLSSTDGSDRHG